MVIRIYTYGENKWFLINPLDVRSKRPAYSKERIGNNMKSLRYWCLFIKIQIGRGSTRSNGQAQRSQNHAQSISSSPTELPGTQQHNLSPPSLLFLEHHPCSLISQWAPLSNFRAISRSVRSGEVLTINNNKLTSTHQKHQQLVSSPVLDDTTRRPSVDCHRTCSRMMPGKLIPLPPVT